MLYMSKIKRICSILLCVLLLAGCAAPQQPGATNPPETVAVKTNYKLAEVTRGTFTQSSVLNCKVNSNRHEYIYCDYEGGILKDKIEVKRGQQVKKGDVLATITYENSDAELARLELAYERAVDSMESGISNYYQRIASIQGSDRLSYLQRMQVEYELGAYKVSANARCEQALEALEEYKDRYTDKEIVAPMDGLVFTVGRVDAGEEIPEGTLLVELVDISVPCVKIKDFTQRAYMLMTPGLDAVAMFKNESFPCVVNGTPNVITSYNQSGENGSVTVSGDVFPITEFEFAVTLTVLELENMLMVPANAVREGGYVMVLEDGRQVKHRVIPGPTGDGDMVCILDGLTEGQQVVLE